MSTPAEPTAAYDLFGQPLVQPGEIVQVKSSPSLRTKRTAAATADGPSGGAPNTAHDSSTAEEQRRRLLAQCWRLRASHRCPGRCVVTGELREGGLAAFRRLAGDEA
jgi:hypothetical protein